jgi:hypothetical protein
MITINSKLEDVLTNTLQKNISLEVDGKVFKTGKLILFSTKYYFICLTLNTSKKQREKVEIPIPFNVEVHSKDNLIYFDYRIKTLTHTNENAKQIIDKLEATKNKFYNKILTIETSNDSRL